MSFSRNVWMVVKGISSTITVQVCDGDGNPVLGIYTGQEPLAAYAWPGDDMAQSFQLTPTWNNGSSGAALGLVDLVAENTATVNLADGVYHWLIQLADSSAALAEGELQISGVPGTGFPGLPDLTTLVYIQSALSSIQLTQAQLEYMPYAMNAASNIVRRFCHRHFARGVRTQYAVPSLDGQVLLDEIPVNSVQRISTRLDTALTVSASEAAFQVAYLNFTTTGDYAGSNTAQVYTGLQLNWISNGSAGNAIIPFADNPTLNDLVNSINANAGWSAEINGTGFGAWPTTELYCQDAGQGALLGSGVTLRVFTQDTSGRIDHRTGMLYLGSGFNTTGLGPRWGPDWQAFDYPGLSPLDMNIVRVIYDSGFDVVPAVVQQGVAEIVRAMISRFKTDYSLKKESIGDYSYELFEFLDAIPQPVKQGLSLYRISNA